MSKETDILGSPGEDNLGLVIDFANKLRSGNLTRAEAKLFLQRKNPWPPVVIQAEPFDPQAFLGQGWSIEEQDKRSLALTEIDLTKVKLKTSLKEGETAITGEEQLKRLKEASYIRLDARFFMALWNNKKLIPEAWKGKTIYFDGTILWGGSRRYVLYLCWDGDEWDWGNDWQYGDRNSRLPSAVLASA